MNLCHQKILDLRLESIVSQHLASMIGENRQLVTYEPVEFEKKPAEVQDCMKITDHFRDLCRIYPI